MGNIETTSRGSTIGYNETTKGYETGRKGADLNQQSCKEAVSE